ncbi:MAG: SpvB/TcaC N-terminal domain-containing protein, partial [Gaiellales bacterium]
MRLEPHLRVAVALLLVLQLLLPSSGAWATTTSFSTLQGTRGEVPAGIPIGSSGLNAFTGAATYQIPIAVAPGTGGMSPSLALRYLSLSRGDSWVGYGWTLGFTSIARSLKGGIPSYDGSDEFTIGGQDLVPGALLSTNPDLRQYHTRREDFSLIVHDETNDTWTVTAKDGTVQRFGIDTGAQPNDRILHGSGSTFEWLLAEEEDVHGNVMTFRYDRTDPGTAYLDEIRYTLRRAAGGGLESIGNDPGADRVVDFILEPGERPDAPVDYLPGFERRVTRRLQQIDVLAGGELVRRYELAYGISPDSFRSLLASVSLHGSDADSASPTAPLVTAFDYHENNTNDANETTGWQLAQSSEFDWAPSQSLVNAVSTGGGDFFVDSGSRLDDVNGDGLPDLVYAQIDFNGVQNVPDHAIYLNTGAGFSATEDPTFETNWPSIPVSPNTPLNWMQDIVIPPSYLWSWGTGNMPIDLTGDGRADSIGIVGIPPAAGDTSGRMTAGYAGPWVTSDGTQFSGVPFSSYYYEYQSTPILQRVYFAKWGFSWTNPSQSLFATTFAYYGGNARFGDLNGDGLADIIVRGRERHALNQQSNCVVRSDYSFVLYNQGDLLFENSPFVPDTVRAYGCNNTYQAISNEFEVCDLTDVSGSAYGACRKKSYFNSDELGTLGSVNDPWVTQAHVEYGNIIIDLNADGLADSASATDDNGNVILWTGLNNGERGYAEEPDWNLPTPLQRLDALTLSPYGSSEGTSTDLGVRLADVNGDGRVDVVESIGSTRNTWLNDGDVNETPSASPWVLETDWSLPAGVVFQNGDGQDEGVRLADVNGDGMTDIVRSQGSTNDVYLNQGSVPDLLVGVTNPRGGVTQIGYAPSTQFDNTGADAIPDLPHVIQVVTSIATDDGFGTVATTNLA